MTRRALVLGGGAALATAATAGTTGFLLSHGSKASSRASGPTAVLPSPTPTPTSAATPTPLPRGGTARLVSPRSFSFDTFDSQRSGEPSVVEVLGRALSRLVQWSDFVTPELGGDLGASWEQPDLLTLVLHLDPAARWQDRSPVNGRAVTADDVVAHLDRMASLARNQLPLLQDAPAYGAIAKVSAVDPHTVRIATSMPDPFLLETLAGRFELLQAPEAVAAFAAKWQDHQPETVVGSGPFVYEGTSDAGALRFTGFRGGHRPSALDGVLVSQPGHDDPSRFLAGDLDEVIARDRRDAPRIRQGSRPFTELVRSEDSSVVTTFYAGSAPWNNPEIVRAISGALNRLELARRLFAGRADPAGLVSPATPAFTLPEQEIETFPGYRRLFADDAAEAKKRWDAAGGAALGAIAIDFPSIFDPLYGASGIVVPMLNEVLGTQFHAAVDTYTSISAKALDRKYGNGHAALWLGWGPPLDSPDPSRWLISTLQASGSTAAELGIANKEPPSLARLAVEFDLEARMALAQDVQRYHLSQGSPGILSWLLQRDEVFRVPALERSAPVPFWSEHLDALVYLRSD